MKILIAEDEALYAGQLEMLCEQQGYEVVALCEDAFSALDAFHRHQPDLLLFDINLAGEIDGIQLALQINADGSRVPVIFITAYRDEATFNRAQASLPAAFILKPFDPLQLQRSIELAVSQLQSKATQPEHDFTQRDLQLTDSFFVKTRGKLEKIRYQDILYLEADGRYAMIHTQLPRKFAVRIPLAELAQKLPDEQFLRTHRSYLINLSCLQSVDVGEMTVSLGATDVPLSKGHKEEVLRRLQLL